MNICNTMTLVHGKHAIVNETIFKRRNLLSTIKIRFSLRNFFLALIAISLSTGYLLSRINEINRKQDFVESLGGRSTLSLYCDSAGIQIPPYQRSMADNVFDSIRFPFSEISNVNLSGATITDHDLQALAENLPNIKCLVLSDTQISDGGIPEIAKLKKLTAIYLDNTKVTIWGNSYLEKAIPAIEIEENIAFREFQDLIEAYSQSE